MSIYNALKQVKENSLILLYQFFFEHCHHLLPNSFWNEKNAPKGSLRFALYARIIMSYNAVVNILLRQDKHLIEALQEKRLRKVFQYASRTKWWRGYFSRYDIQLESMRTLKDLRLIPPISRIDIADAPREDFISMRILPELVDWTQSSGSTTGIPFVWGRPKSVPYLSGIAQNIRSLEERGFIFQEHWKENFFSTFNYSIETPPYIHFWGNKFWLDSDNLTMRQKLRSMVDGVGKTSACVLRVAPSELFSLVHKLKEYDLHPPISFVATTGQMLDAGVRQFAEGYLSCPVFPLYAMRELNTPVGLECKDNPDLYHPPLESVILEILTDSGETALFNELGRITITSLENLLMPLIRYQPGDIGIMHSNISCTCKNQPKILFELIGRNIDFIEFSDGTKELASRIFRTLGQYPFLPKVRRMQVRQETLDAARIIIEIREPLGQDLRKELSQRIEAMYNGKLKAEIEEVNVISQGGTKFKSFIPLSVKTKTGTS